jgi:hypothetical protein
MLPRRIWSGGLSMFWTLLDITSAAMDLVVAVFGLLVVAILLSLPGAT